MKKSCIILSVFSLVHGVMGMDAIEWLNTSGGGEVVSVSSTNLLFQIKANSFTVKQHDMYDKFLEESKTNSWAKPYRNSSEYIKNNELLVITPDGVTQFLGQNVRLEFIPVSFRTQQKGLKIIRISQVLKTVTEVIGYVALSDTPMEVGEEDVEMIWKDGKFRTLDEYQFLVQLENEEKEEHYKFLARFIKAGRDRYENEDDRRDFHNKLNAMGSKEAILAYLDELDRQDELERQQNEPPMPNMEDETLSVSDVPSPPNETALPPSSHPARRAWLWWLALPVVAGAWLVFHLKKRRR